MNVLETPTALSAKRLGGVESFEEADHQRDRLDGDI